MSIWKFTTELDTAKSFQGFCCYRDLGPTRSLENAYDLYKGRKGKTIPGFFRQWCSKGQWVDRAHASDLESDRIRQSDLSSEARRTHEQRIEQIRSTAESLAITQLKTSLTTALLVQDAIDRLKARWENSFDDVQQEI